MSDSFEDFPPARATDDYMTTAEINEAIRIKHTDPDPSIAWLQSRILELEASVKYWRDASEHMFHVKGGCSCQGRDEKLWCRRCWIKQQFRKETGEGMK